MKKIFLRGVSMSFLNNDSNDIVCFFDAIFPKTIDKFSPSITIVK